MFGISQDILYLVVSNNSSSIALTLTPVLWIKTDRVHNNASYEIWHKIPRKKSAEYGIPRPKSKRTSHTCVVLENIQERGTIFDKNGNMGSRGAASFIPGPVSHHKRSMFVYYSVPSPRT